MSDFKRRAVNFNVENEHQRTIYEWVTRKSPNNFSGFVKSVLYAAMVAESKQKRKAPDNGASD